MKDRLSWFFGTNLNHCRIKSWTFVIFLFLDVCRNLKTCQFYPHCCKSHQLQRKLTMTWLSPNLICIIVLCILGFWVQSVAQTVICSFLRITHNWWLSLLLSLNTTFWHWPLTPKNSFHFKPLFIQINPIDIIDLFFEGDLQNTLYDKKDPGMHLHNYLLQS